MYYNTLYNNLVLFILIKQPFIHENIRVFHYSDCVQMDYRECKKSEKCGSCLRKLGDTVAFQFCHIFTASKQNLFANEYKGFICCSMWSELQCVLEFAKKYACQEDEVNEFFSFISLSSPHQVLLKSGEKCDEYNYDSEKCSNHLSNKSNISSISLNSIFISLLTLYLFNYLQTFRNKGTFSLVYNDINNKFKVYEPYVKVTIILEIPIFPHKIPSFLLDYNLLELFVCIFIYF